MGWEHEQFDETQSDSGIILGLVDIVGASDDPDMSVADHFVIRLENPAVKKKFFLCIRSREEAENFIEGIIRAANMTFGEQLP